MEKQETKNTAFNVLIVVQYVISVWFSLLGGSIVTEYGISNWVVLMSFIVPTFAVHYFLIFLKFKRRFIEDWCSKFLKIFSIVILSIQLYSLFPGIPSFFSPGGAKILIYHIPYIIFLLLLGAEILIHSLKKATKQQTETVLSPSRAGASPPPITQ